MKSNLTAGRLRSVLKYAPETGLFTWKQTSSNRAVAESAAGSKMKNGYIDIGVDGNRYLAHRLAWLYMTGEWPRAEVDHINGIPSANWFSNLREATSAQNKYNRRLDGRNTSGRKGVSWHKASQKWSAQIRVNDKKVHLGLYPTVESAHTAYCKAARAHYGDYARTA